MTSVPQVPISTADTDTDPERSILESDAAIAQVQQLLGLADLDTVPEQIRVQLHIGLRDLLYGRFQATSAVQDLDEAIEQAEAIVSILSQGQGNHAPHLDKLAYYKTTRFQISQSKADLDDAVDLGEEAMAILQSTEQQDTPDWIDIVTNLGYSLSLRYQKYDQLDDLDEAVRLAEEVLTLTVPDTQLHHASLLNLSSRLHLRFVATGNIADSEAGLAINRQILETCSAGTVEFGAAMYNLAHMTAARYEQTGFWRHLEEGIRLLKLGLSSYPPDHELRPQFVSSISSLLTKKFNQTKDLSDLREAARFSKDAVLATPLSDSAHSTRDDRLFTHMNLLSQLATNTTELPEIEQAISEAHGFLAPLPVISLQRIANQRLYGDILSHRYELSGSPWHLQHLVECALELATDCNRVLNANDEQVGHVDYDTASLASLLEKVTNLALEQQDHHIVIQVNNSMHREYKRLCQKEQFMEALVSLENDVVIHIEIVVIASERMAVEECSRLVKLGESIGAKTFQFRIKMRDMALKELPEEKAERSSGPIEELEDGGSEPVETPVAIEAEVASLAQRVKDNTTVVAAALESGDSTDIEQAIAQTRSTLDLADIDPVARNECLTLLSSLDYLQFELTGEGVYLDRASSQMKEVLDTDAAPELVVTDSNTSTRANLLCDLAESLRARALQTMTETDLESAIVFANAAIEATRNLVSPERLSIDPSGRLRSETHVRARLALANILKSRFQLNGTVDSLDAAIEHAQSAMELQAMIPFGRIETLASLRNQYALMMRLRYLELGDLNDINVAIAQLEGLSEDTKLSKTSGHILQFQSPVLNQTLGPALNNSLGLLYSSKAERTNDPEDTQGAIDCTRAALELIPTNNPSWAGLAINLGNALYVQYLQTGTAEQLTEAVRYVRAGINSPAQHPTQRPVILNDASQILIASYGITKDPEELLEVSALIEGALALSPPQNSLRAYLLYNLGQTLELRYTLDPCDQLLAKATESYVQAFECNSSSSSAIGPRVSSARNAARLLAKRSRWDEAYKCLDSLVIQMTLVCPRWLTTSDRLYILCLFYGISADAAAAAIQTSFDSGASPYNAIRSLELTRGVLLGSTMDYRSMVKHLETASPDIAKKWYKLCMEFDAISNESGQPKITRREQVTVALMNIIQLIRQIPGFESFSPPLPLGSLLAYELRETSPEIFELYYQLNREFESFPPEKSGGRGNKRQREVSGALEDLIEDIRRLDGFEDFMLPLGQKAVLELASEGPIIIVNSSSLINRSDAIIVQKSGIEVVPLPLFHYADIEGWMKEREDIVRGWTLRNIAGKNKSMLALLRWLWTSAVKPVLRHLKMISPQPTGAKPRVHWIGVGQLSMAPFHAAGIHKVGSTANTISHVVSSYIPTLRALSFAREKPPSHNLGYTHRRLLLVAVPEVAGAAKLPATLHEVDSLASISDSRVSVVRLESPTPAEVLHELPLAHMVHFACHAISDPTDIGNSHLLLNPDRSEDGVAGELSVRQISASRAPSAELAFLSVCSGAENRATTLADECIHIANAFQLAGFRNVVGALWPARDICCEEVAKEFYKHYLEADDPLPVADSLHRAVELLRLKNPMAPLSWAPFIHIGA